LVYSTLLSNIVEECKLNWRYDKYALYPYNTKTQSKIFVLADKRNDILKTLEKDEIIKVDDWQKIKNESFYRGWELYFTSKINNKKYQWWYKLKEQTDTGEWQEVENVNLNNLGVYLRSHQLI